MFQLFPKDRWFFDQFNAAARNLHEASTDFVELLKNFSESNLIAATQHIKELEHSGDHLTHRVVDRLNKSFLTPFDREDIYQLISRMDDVLDMTDSAASRILHYRIGVPPEKLTQLVIVLDRATAVVETLVNSFQPKLAYAKIKPYLELIHQHENDGDQLQRDALMDLFDNEKDPIRVIKLKQIYEFIESSIDKCEDVANVIEGICVKHA